MGLRAWWKICKLRKDEWASFQNQHGCQVRQGSWTTDNASSLWLSPAWGKNESEENRKGGIGFFHRHLRFFGINWVRSMRFWTNQWENKPHEYALRAKWTTWKVYHWWIQDVEVNRTHERDDMVPEYYATCLGALAPRDNWAAYYICGGTWNRFIPMEQDASWASINIFIHWRNTNYSIRIVIRERALTSNIHTCFVNACLSSYIF